MKEYKSYEDLPATLSAEQISRYLGISRAGGYNLLKEKGFPTLKIGKRVLVPKDAFLTWVNMNTRNKKELK